MRYRALFFTLLLCFLFACSAVVSPDEGLLGGGGDTDTGVGGGDTGPPIVLMDGGPGDGGPGDAMTTSPPDSTVIDTAAPCMGDPYCMGEILVGCDDGTVTTTSCAAMSSYCEDGECRDWECDPGTSRCDGDGRVAICDDRGTGETRMDCPHGCDPSTASCRPGPLMCPGIPPLAPGAAVRVNTCGSGDDATYEPTGDSGGCPADVRSNGPDLIYAITLATRQTITLDLRDDDGRAAIDTVIYLRRDCEDGESQIACRDDLPCDETDFGCSGSGRFEVRQSRITVDLEPGTYYVVIDSINYTTSGGSRFTCGDVLLRYFLGAITPTP